VVALISRAAIYEKPSFVVLLLLRQAHVAGAGQRHFLASLPTNAAVGLALPNDNAARALELPASSWERSGRLQGTAPIPWLEGKPPTICLKTLLFSLASTLRLCYDTTRLNNAMSSGQGEEKQITQQVAFPIPDRRYSPRATLN